MLLKRKYAFRNSCVASSLWKQDLKSRMAALRHKKRRNASGSVAMALGEDSKDVEKAFMKLQNGSDIRGVALPCTQSCSPCVK